MKPEEIKNWLYEKEFANYVFAKNTGLKGEIEALESLASARVKIEKLNKEIESLNRSVHKMDREIYEVDQVIKAVDNLIKSREEALKETL